MTRQRETERTALVEQQRLARLVETMDDGLLLLDEQGRVGLANLAAHRLLDTGLARPDTSRGHVTDDDPLDWAAVIGRAIERLGADSTRVGRLREAFRLRTAIVGEEFPFDDGRVLELDLVPVPAPASRTRHARARPRRHRQGRGPPRAGGAQPRPGGDATGR